MITIFNRSEVLITYDMKRQAEVRSILANHKIDYQVKVMNLSSPSPFTADHRASIGTFGEKLMMEYKIYVKKTDLEEAIYLINQVPS